MPDYARDYPQKRCLFWIPETKRVLRLLFQAAAINDPFFKYNRFNETVAYFRYLFGPRTTFYVFSWRDPRPFVSDVSMLIAKIWRSVFAR